MFKNHKKYVKFVNNNTEIYNIMLQQKNINKKIILLIIYEIL